MDFFKSAFVIGGSSKVAYSICIKLAQNGCKRFHLVSRDLNRNNHLIQYLKNNYEVNITQEKYDLSLNNIIKRYSLLEIGFYDLYVIAAGYLGDEGLAQEEAFEALKIQSVNYINLLPWIINITNRNRINKKGSLWVFSSVASDRGRPSNYNYGASKAALTTFCEGILLRCQNKPFSVRIIKAGYIDTPMARGAPSFLCISPDKVAQYLMRRPYKRGIEYLPWWWIIVMFIVRLIPAKFASKL
tara:strand:- start:1590 stop:2318 length:729 start_codon:yes stop_codon:yes gene_type:complete